MIETKLDNTKVKGLALELVGDFAVIVDTLHNKVGISKVLLDQAYAMGLKLALEEDKLECKAELGAEVIAELILNAIRETWGEEDDDEEESKESCPCAECREGNTPVGR